MKAQVISFRCVLRNKLGQVLGTAFNRDVLTGIRGAQDELQSLALALQDLKPGEKRQVSLSANEAYGFYDPKKVVTIAKEALPGLLKEQKARLKDFRIINQTGDQIVVDANHPLAGQDLIFDIEAVTARDATPDELFDSLPEVDLRH